jgi:hypothetical protein
MIGSGEAERVEDDFCEHFGEKRILSVPDDFCLYMKLNISLTFPMAHWPPSKIIEISSLQIKRNK